MTLLWFGGAVLQARQSAANARADRLLAQYRVLQAMGGLLEYLDLGAGLPARP